LVSTGQVAVAYGLFGTPADNIQLPFKRHAVFQQWAALDKHLADHRLGRNGGWAESFVNRRHRSPTEDLLPFLLNNGFEPLLKVSTKIVIGRQENHPNAIISWARQGKTQGRAFFDQKGMGHL
jgi:hypothetical protein